MIIGIHPDQTGVESFSRKWTEFLHDRGVEVRELDLLSSDALVHAQQCDGIMWRATHSPRLKQAALKILYVIEHYCGIPVYPNYHSFWHYDEKIAQYYLLQALQAPVPQTWLFWHRDEALAWAKTAPYPVVFKLSVGASSSNVIKVHSEAEATRLITQIFKRGIFPMTMNEHSLAPIIPQSLVEVRAVLRRWLDSLNYFWNGNYPQLHSVWWKPEHGYAYFQEFLPNNEFDTRITVVGDRAFGFRRMNRSNDFRASGSGNLLAEPNLIDKRCVEIAFQLSQQGKFQSMAYDFLFKEETPVINEISYTFASWAIHQCPGYWDSSLNWHNGQMWVEEAQIEDFLSEIQARKRFTV